MRKFTYLEKKNPKLWKNIKEIKENLFNKQTKDIFEITFSYDEDTNFNTTLFQEFAGFENTKEKKYSSEELYMKTTNCLVNLEKKFDHYINILKEQSNNKKYDKEIKIILQILENSLVYHKKIICLTKLGLPFEIEKYTWELYLYDEREVPDIVAQMEEIEKDLFGGNVRDSEMEVSSCVSKLEHQFEEFWNTLSEAEKQKFQEYIQKAKKLTTFNQGIYEKSMKGNTQKSSLEGGIWDTKISREDVVKIFQKVLKIYDINKPVLISKWRSSIYDWEDGLEIPDNYTTIRLGRILCLIQHEISTHYLTLDWTENLLWWIKWAYNLNIEEWLAITFENYLQGIIYNKYNVSKSLPLSLMWEILTGEEYDNFYKILHKWEWTRWNYLSFLLRRKRLYPLKDRWIQHKDTTYTRWQHLIFKDCINKWYNILDLFSIRWNIHDSILLSKLWLNKKPLPISDFIVEKILNPEINIDSFYKKINKKYKDLTHLKGTRFDIFTTQQKGYISEILWILSKWL